MELSILRENLYDNIFDDVLLQVGGVGVGVVFVIFCVEYSFIYFWLPRTHTRHGTQIWRGWKEAVVEILCPPTIVTDAQKRDFQAQIIGFYF